MDEITAVFANAYRSERLVYRDIENSDADKELMHKFGPANHVSWGFLNGRLFRDISKKANFDALSKLLESDLLLKILICLPAPREEIVELGKLGLGSRAAKERETATAIGSLTLSAPREGSLQAPTTTVGLCISEEYQNQVRHMKHARKWETNTERRRTGLRRRSYKLGRGLGIQICERAQGGDCHIELQRESYVPVSEARLQLGRQKA